MRAVIIGTDFVRDTDGSFKAIETNTNIHPAVNVGWYLNTGSLDSIISGSSINEIHLIVRRNQRSGYAQEIELTPESDREINSDQFVILAKVLENYASGSGCLFNNIVLEAGSMTIPQIDDSPNKLIIRLAYDVTALIDDTYARDNWEFLKLMYDSNPTSIPATYINDVELGFDSIGTTLRDNGVHPNYIVKKRITPADNHIWPKVYKINTIQELNTLKTSIAVDEYIQEYILNSSDTLDNRLTHYRSVDLIYGPDLTVLNLWNVEFSNTIELDNLCDLDDENKIQLWERPKYIYKYNNNEKQPKISADGSTRLFLPDSSLVLLSSLSENDVVKSISIPGLPINEADYNVVEWTGSYDNIMNNFQISSSVLTNIIKREDYTGFFYNVNLSGSVTFSDVGHAIVMKKESIQTETGSLDVVKFVDYTQLNQGDTMILYDSQTNGLTEKVIETITISYDKVEVYAVNFEQLDLFLTSEESMAGRYGLLTHNYSYDCKSITTTSCIYCSACGAPGSSYSFWVAIQCCKCGNSPHPPCQASSFLCLGDGCTYPAVPCVSAGYCNEQKSDIRYKENVELVGKSYSGINIYQFNYKNEEGLYEGVIGNELIGTQFENALHFDSNGLISVDYYKIDVQFKKIK